MNYFESIRFCLQVTGFNPTSQNILPVIGKNQNDFNDNYDNNGSYNDDNAQINSTKEETRIKLILM